jgi:hypothetical protein
MPSQKGRLMPLFRVLTLTMAALVVSTPGISLAGGRLGMGRGHSFGEPSGSISTFTMSPREHRRFDRTPFDGTAVIPWDPYDSDPYVVIPEGPAGVPVPVIVRNAPPSEPPPADPKFVFPPTPSAQEPPGTQSVIIQRGSKIEVQSFPAAR